MKKNTNLCVDLKTVMQNDVLLVEGQCYTGVLTRDSKDHFLFEEAVRKAYERVKEVSFDNAYYRKDIGKRALDALKKA